VIQVLANPGPELQCQPATALSGPDPGPARPDVQMVVLGPRGCGFGHPSRRHEPLSQTACRLPPRGIIPTTCPPLPAASRHRPARVRVPRVRALAYAWHAYARARRTRERVLSRTRATRTRESVRVVRHTESPGASWRANATYPARYIKPLFNMIKLSEWLSAFYNCIVKSTTFSVFKFFWNSFKFRKREPFENNLAGL
jgi:hypothetical protein